jgi:type VI secretion system secreted protein VgrG
MTTALTEQIASALVAFSSATRLYELKIRNAGDDLGSGGLLVEGFAADDAVNEVSARDVIVLSTSAYIEPDALLGQPAALEISLADGTRTAFAGDVSEVAMLGSDGGFARYRVRISSWLGRLEHGRNSRVWQDKSVIDIIDSVFQPYQPLAKWRWSDETGPFIADAMPRSYCCQYRESDLDFVRRVLAAEGLNWRFEQTDDGPGMVLFADSTQRSAIPEDPSSALDSGIHYHRASSVEHHDTLQALVAQRRLHASLTTVLSYDYKSKQGVASSSPTHRRIGRNLPALESFDVPGQYAYANSGQAQRYADLQMEAKEARSQLWQGRSTVRTLREGTQIRVTGAPRQGHADTLALLVLQVTSIGLNNLPSQVGHALTELFGPVPELLRECRPSDRPDDLALMIGQATESGYANCFTAVPVETPWRPQLPGSDSHTHSKPTAFGAQSAIVIGPDGDDSPSGANELYCDRLGRVRIRFHWQDSANASCWVRVAQRAAGGGMGSQFLPRIGQEVLVQFLEGDIDRPVIVGALYNGRGEGAVAPTPGGQADSASDTSCFGRAHDHAYSAQGNLAGGNSPVWHGAAGDSEGHRNPGAQWGIRSKEFGGLHYNQLLFDDTDAQGRIQLKCSPVATELNLGRLNHACDNYRGSFRGMGAELRTDGHGAVRATAGLLVSSNGIGHRASSREPAGEHVQGNGLLRQTVKLGEMLSSAAMTHLSVGLAAFRGTINADASVLNDKAAPVNAVLTSMSGMVDKSNFTRAMTDASAGKTSSGEDKLPYSANSLVALSANADVAANAGQGIQFASGETATLTSGQDAQLVSGSQMRIQTRQAIGVLGGAVNAGESSIGLQLIAAKDTSNVQAQADEITVQAREEVSVVSASAHIDWASAKRISLSTAGGATITIEGGNITAQCPGKIAVHAGKKSLIDPDKLNYPLPKLPRSELPKRALHFKMRLTDTPGPNAHPLANTPWKIAYGDMPRGLKVIDEEKVIAEGITDAKGDISLTQADEDKLATAYAQHPDGTWLVYPGHVARLDVQTESPDWDEKQKLLHALNAADFSLDLHSSLFDDGALPQSHYAKEAFDTPAVNDIFPKVTT